MATTNIDAVAEFKILTNAYQAEYGRAVGGQVQVVTKSGTQSFHGSGYWYGRRSDWNANTWTNKRRCDRPGRRPRTEPETSRNDSRLHDRRPDLHPGRSTRTSKKLFFFWSQEFQQRAGPGGRAPEPRADRARAARRLLAERRQQRQPVPLHPRLSARAGEPGLPCSAADTARLLPGRRRARPDPREPPLPAGLERAQHLPDAELRRAAAASTTPARPRQRAAARRPAAHGLPGHRQLARHRPLHEDEGRHPAGLRHDVGRHRQRPARTTPTLFEHPGSNYMLSATGILNTTTSLEVSWGRAHNSLDFIIQNENLFRAARRASRAAAALPGRGAGRLHPRLPLPRRPHGQRRPATRPTAVRSPTRTRPTT